MRLGVLWSPSSNAEYRAFEPMQAMARRGHEVVWPDDTGFSTSSALRACDVVHVYRRTDRPTERLVTELRKAGVAITFDDDDNHAAVPKESPSYKIAGGFRGQQVFAASLKMAKRANYFTTTSPTLAENYRRGGVTTLSVIGNYLSPDIPRPSVRHDGLVVGWVAAHEHLADAARIAIGDALRRILERHPNVTVKCIGVDLELPERYRHTNIVPFRELPRHVGGFDIGIAPLADIPMNHARSDIKLKEYAKSGVPWLASPVGPYAGFGEAEGGRLVEDDAWFDELDRLIARKRDRRRLARNAKRWAATQTIDAAADRWEAVFAQASQQMKL